MGFVGVYETEGEIVPAHCMEHMSFKGPFNPNYSMVLLEKTPLWLLRLNLGCWRPLGGVLALS